MTLKITGLSMAAALGLAASASLAAKAPIPLKPSVSCDVQLNVVDHDPKGLNVRATPEVRPDNIRTVIPLVDWTLVHVTGMAGDWYEIDHYTSYPDNADESEHDLPGGHRGWVHKSKLGDVRAMHGSMMYAAPSDHGKPIYTFGPEEADITVLGCQGSFLKIQYKSAIGWSNAICTNDRTTCV